MVSFNGKLCGICFFIVNYYFDFSSLQGSITDDKSKGTHHIYPSPSQQEDGRVELSFSLQIRKVFNHKGIIHIFNFKLVVR